MTETGRAGEGSTVQRAAAYIRALIVRGEVLSGERLVELTLAKRLSVSQNSVREALTLLEAEGWVVKSPRTGAHVRAFTLDEAAETYALLAALETLALGWVFNSSRHLELPSLRATLTAARTRARDGERDKAIAALFRFHELLIAAAKRPQTIAIHGRLMNAARLLEMTRQARIPSTPPELEAHLVRHEMLLRAFIDGDAVTANRLLHEQFEAYAALVQEALA